MTERRRLPDERKSITRKLRINHSTEAGTPATLDIYLHVGLYDDGTPGELFLKADKMGSTVSGLLDALAMSVSIGLQGGVSLGLYTSKMRGMKFEPAGMTGDADLGIAHSIVDAVARWLEKKFPPPVES
jgi:ribonucleoside-diphosphate reductase alpha chain